MLHGRLAPRSAFARSLALVALAFLHSVAASAGISGVPSSAAVPAATDAAPVPRDVLLPNGLRILAMNPGPTRQSGGGMALLFVPAGWEHDPPRKSGVAEITAGAAVAASVHHGAQALHAELAGLETSLTASVASDYTLLELRSAKAESLAQALPLLAEVVQEPAFPRAAIDAACAGLTARLSELERQPVELARQVAPALLLGMYAPAAGLPDPWRARVVNATEVIDFHAARYAPQGSILVLSGLDAEQALLVASGSFSRWVTPKRTESAPVSGDSPSGPGEPGLRVALVAPRFGTEGGTAVAITFPAPPAQDAALALTRHALIYALADLLGLPEAVPAPLPASRLDVLAIAVPGAASAELARVRKALATLAEQGPAPEVLDAWHARLVDSDLSARQSQTSYASFLAGILAFRGLPSGLVSSETPASRLASEIKGLAASGWRCVVVAEERELQRIRGADVGRLRPFQAPTQEGRQAETKGRELVSAALSAQGDPARLKALRHVDERAEGMYHGIGTHVGVRTRFMASLPDSAYLESVMYNHRRFIMTRLVDGRVWVDRSSVGTREEPQDEKGRLVLRQMHAHPAFVLARVLEDGWMRHAGRSEQKGIELIDALHPMAGLLRLHVRTRDKALVGIDLDLMPLEGTVESHRYDRFVTVDGVRMPSVESATAGGRPWRDMELKSTTFPAEIKHSFYMTERVPDDDVLQRPGPPDGPTTAEPAAEQVIETQPAAADP